MTHRFFVEGPIGDEAVLHGERAHQIATVLRLDAGDVIALVWEGIEAIVVLESVSPDEVRGRVRDKRKIADTEPRVQLTLALPLLRGERSEEVIEAVTQLGVSTIVPFVSARSVVRTLSKAKLERWTRIARESAETARRGRVPTIEAVTEWPALFERLVPPVIVPWEGEALKTLTDALSAPISALSLVVGPEGGIGPDEIRLAWDQGATTVTLGRRNLRSETAAIAAVAQAMAILER
jgi:16S rRNA (uracil1498-N3)-methyltransferase